MGNEIKYYSISFILQDGKYIEKKIEKQTFEIGFLLPKKKDETQKVYYLLRTLDFAMFTDTLKGVFYVRLT